MKNSYIHINEPNGTLSWASYHLFDRDFSNKYSQNKLTRDEWKVLLERSIQHRKNMLSTRTFWEKYLKAYDTTVMQELERLLRHVVNGNTPYVVCIPAPL